MRPHRVLRLLLVGIGLAALPPALFASTSNLDPARLAAIRSAATQAQPAPGVFPRAAMHARTQSARADVESATRGTPNARPPAAGSIAPSLIPSAEGTPTRVAEPEPGRRAATAAGALVPGPVPSSYQPTAILPRMLYAPTADDDPAYRSNIAALTGGTVDYYDARLGTPSAAVLASYDCVYTWVGNPYSDPVTFGNRLADYVDAGGKVILGAFCTFTSGIYLDGRIMTPGYCPVVSPGGTNHYALSAYAGDGITYLHAGVLAYDCVFRDVLVTQGSGIVDGHYADGEIAQAYRPDGRVIYSNGGGGSALAGAGGWPQIIANAWMGKPSAPSVLYAPANSDDVLYRASIAALTGGVVNYFGAQLATPSAALLATYDCVYTHPNAVYASPTVFGDRLADFVDGGGKVVLGVFTTFDGFALGGRIMTPGYNPVASPATTNHYSWSAYAGDGTTSLHTGVLAYASQFRDFLVAQTPGVVDGHYADGEIAQAYRPDGRVVYTNGAGLLGWGTGDWPRIVANACTRNLATGPRMLYAPSEADNPDYREAIAERTGGTVDYFNASSGTPSAALLASYDCVFTWANFGYADKVLFGDRLANYVDAGGKVVLGVFCTYTGGNSLGGRIMTSAYSPVVSPLGNNHGSPSPYLVDGTTRFHHGVTAYGATYRDVLVTQGAGKVDGHYTDGEIALAYRPDRRVIYANGACDPLLGATGDWPQVVANVCLSRMDGGMLFGCDSGGQLFNVDVLTGNGYFVANLPTFGVGGATEIEYDPGSGVAWLQASDGAFLDQAFSLGNGAALGPPVANGASFPGLEFALGKLYGTAMTGPCGPSDLRTLNPISGASSVIGPTGLGPVSGLAFEPRTSAMYGAGGCSTTPPAQFVRLDVTLGTATVINTTPFFAGGLEFAGDGDLYAGGNAKEGGNLYRVNPTTGVTALIGPTGFLSVTGLAYVPINTVAVEPVAQNRLFLAAPIPNPSPRGAVQLRFTLPAGGDARLDLFDVAGRLVWQKDWTGLAAGEHGVAWDGRTTAGRLAGPGVYHARLSTPAGTRTVKLVRLNW